MVVDVVSEGPDTFRVRLGGGRPSKLCALHIEPHFGCIAACFCRQVRMEQLL